MCGIAGWLTASGASREAEVGQMLSVVANRGPDGEGLTNHNGVTLGHRRLAVLDLSVDGAQPMHRDHATVSFNGEIYNYVELRAELRALGHSFRSGSDTEVLLAAYLQWGTQAVERFDGMWAFAIYDSRNNTLFLSRDRFGEKPFVYAQSAGNFVFASEARQLRSVGFGREADELAVREMIAFGSQVSDEATFYRGVSHFPAATNLVIDCADLTMQWATYYRAGASGLFKGINPNELPSVFAEEFERSVCGRLRSDVQVGMLLSGGIDSSLIASVAGPRYLEASGSRLLAFTAASGDPTNDESEWARSAARSSGVEWVPVAVPSDDARESWAEATRTIGKPLGSSSVTLQLHVMKAAKRAGCTVLLDGQGADESWLGYPRYAVSALRDLPISKRVSFARESADKSGLGLSRWLAYAAYFSSPKVAEIRGRRRLNAVGISIDSDWYREAFATLVATGSRPLREVQQQQLQGAQLGNLLEVADRTSMSVSLEDRMPFLDARLVELAMEVPTTVMFRDGWSKWLLRQMLAKSAEPAVAWRKKKVGFESARETFDPRDSDVHRVINQSSILRELGSSRWDLAKADTAILWRLFAVALWEGECLT